MGSLRALLLWLSIVPKRFVKTITSAQDGPLTTLRIALIALLGLWAHLAAAATLTGTVLNKTTNKPAGNDDVVLIALAQNMQEVSRTRTDANGHYRLDLPDGNMHLIRVDHQKASYFASIGPGVINVDVTVYDVSPKLNMVSLEADMVRMETDANGLHVIESYFVKNDSDPPKTQFSAQGFEIYLPPDSRIDASVAMGPGGMPVASSPVPSGEAGHYSFIFPIRPGETRFQVEYHVPYTGSRQLELQLSLRTDNLAVVLPESMKLQAGEGSSFEALRGTPGTRSLLAKNILPRTSVRFTVTGTGTLPRDDQNVDPGASGAKGTIASPATAGARPGETGDSRVTTPTLMDRGKWWILGGIALALVIVAGVLLRSSPSVERGPSAPVGPSSRSPEAAESPWLTALKENLFALETERLTNLLSDEEYQTQKAAFEIVLKRALARQANAASELSESQPPPA